MSPSPSVTRPIAVSVPRRGVFFAESIHDERFEMSWRCDPFHKCIYVLRGATLRVERGRDRPVLVRQGSLTLIPAGLEHRLEDRDPCILLMLCLARDFLDEDPEMTGLWQTLSRRHDQLFLLGSWSRRRVEKLWRHAILEQTMTLPGCGVSLKATVAQILVQLARMRTDKSADDADQRVGFVIREMEESFFDEWNLDRAAARAEMSRRAFSVHFRALTGQTFLKRLTELRLRHAAQLLELRHHSIAGAAFSSGFGDLSHFYRVFRQHYKMTPKAWAEQAANRGGPKGLRKPEKLR